MCLYNALPSRRRLFLFDGQHYCQNTSMLPHNSTHPVGGAVRLAHRLTTDHHPRPSVGHRFLLPFPFSSKSKYFTQFLAYGAPVVVRLPHGKDHPKIGLDYLASVSRCSKNTSSLHTTPTSKSCSNVAPSSAWTQPLPTLVVVHPFPHTPRSRFSVSCSFDHCCPTLPSHFLPTHSCGAQP